MFDHILHIMTSYGMTMSQIGTKIIYGTFKDFILTVGMPGPKIYTLKLDSRSFYHLTNFTVYIVL